MSILNEEFHPPAPVQRRRKSIIYAYFFLTITDIKPLSRFYSIFLFDIAEVISCNPVHF